MKIIHAIELDRLRNAEYIQLGEDAKKIIDGMLTATPDINPFAADFNSKMAAINAVFMNDPASPLTHEIEDLDARRDAAIVGLGFVARGYTYSTDAAKREAAEKLSRSISIYSDSIAQQSLIAESASVTNLLADFSNKPELAAAITTLGLSDWITELQDANDALKAKYLQRTAAYGDESPDTVRGLRMNADTAFKKLVEKITAYYSIHDGATPWNTLVSRFNAMIDQYNTLIASHPPGKPRAVKGNRE